MIFKIYYFYRKLRKIMKDEKEIDRNKVPVGIEGSEFVEMESSMTA